MLNKDEVGRREERRGRGGEGKERVRETTNFGEKNNLRNRRKLTKYFMFKKSLLKYKHKNFFIKCF